MNSVKRHSCSARNLRLVYDLHKSVIDGLILLGLCFHENSNMRSFAKINFRENFRIYNTSIKRVLLSNKQFSWIFTSWRQHEHQSLGFIVAKATLKRRQKYENTILVIGFIRDILLI